MKKKILIVITLLVAVSAIKVKAETLGYLTVDKEEIESGENFTAKVELNDVAAWNIKVYISGEVDESCVVKEIKLADGEKKLIINKANVTEDAQNTNQTFTVTCKSKEKGEIILTLIGDITSSDEKGVDLKETKTIVVKEGKTVNKVKPEVKKQETKENHKSNALLNMALVVLAGCIILGLVTYIKKKKSEIEK